MTGHLAPVTPAREYITLFPFAGHRGSLPMRRFVAVSVALLALFPAAAGLSVPEVAAAGEDAQRLAFDLTGALDRTVTLPLAAPLPADATGIGPGSMLITTIEGVDYLCTANWVWRSGGAHYLGAAGHCFLPEDRTSTHGAGRDYDASGVRVRVCVADCGFGGQLGFLLTGTLVDLGEVAYARQTRDGFAIGNDFGVVRIPDHLVSSIRREMPVWGRAAAVGELQPGDLTCHYGHASALGEVFVTKARVGVGIVTMPDGSWRSAVASNQGDSGAAVATCRVVNGDIEASSAFGLLTHLSGTGVAGTTVPRAVQLAAEASLALTVAL